jgi:hypothetical protein
MNLKNQLLDLLTDLWEEPTTLEAITRDISFWFVASFTFYFFVLLVGFVTTYQSVVSDVAIKQISLGIQWSNFFLNILTFLVILEVSSYIAKAYWDYRRDTL